MRNGLIATVSMLALLAAGRPLGTAAWGQGGGQQPQGRGRFHGPTPEEREAARVKIGLSQQQEQAIESLYKRFEPVRAEFRDLNRQLWDEYHKWDYDRFKVDAIRGKLLQLQRKMSDIRADNESHIRRIMTKDQFLRMQKLVESDRSRRRSAPPGAPPGPH